MFAMNAAPTAAPGMRTTPPRLALLFSDGSLTILSPDARPDEAVALRDACNAAEFRRDRMARIVTVSFDVEDVDDLEPLEDAPHA